MKRIYACCMLLAACFAGTGAEAQKKLLILGSSTSACYNLSADSCYVGRLQRYYQSAGSPVVIDNRAVAGDNCYQGMPMNFTPPAGRSTPRPYNNITEGLQGNPDVVLVNYPSNGYDEYSVQEVMNCLRTIRQTAIAAGKPCYITTTQPRSDPASYQTAEVQQKMRAIKESILSEFGAYAINFWDGVVNDAGTALRDSYNSGDGIHLNSAGHSILFNRVVEKNIFGQAGGLTYRYYEGNWNALPDFNSLTPVKTGQAANISLDSRNTNDFFGFVWEGNITISTPGTYTFETVSDDGSKFYFNTAYSAGAPALVTNDGLHAPVSASGSVYIPAAGTYPVAAAFFENNSGEQMQLYWSGPGIQRQLVPDGVFSGKPSPTGGLGYRYYEGSWNMLPDFDALSPVKTGTSSNVNIGNRTAGRNDNYAFVWQGYINIPAAGNYTFETVSDDGSRFYFNSFYSSSASSTVNNDGLHPAVSATGTVYVSSPGAYPVAISFFENDGGEQMQLYWSGPGFGRQLIPDAAFTPPPAASGGLSYAYYEGNWNALPDFSTLNPLKTGTSANLDLGVRTPGVNDHFALKWDGYINLPAAGTYTFETISDDGSKVYFNTPYTAGAASLVSNDGLHGPSSATGMVNVSAAGRYPLTVTFFEKEGGETMQLYWTGPGFSRQPVPDAAFAAANAAGSALAVASLQEAGAEPFSTATVYPNPFTQSFAIDYFNNRSTGGKVQIILYDLAGRRVYETQSGLATGYNKWTIPAGRKIMAGVYVLQLNVQGLPVKTITMIKTK